IAGARVVEQREGEGRAIRVEVASNASTPQQRRVVLTGLNGAAPITQDVTIEPDRVATMDLPLPEGAAEQVVKLQLEPADGLTDDDQFWLPLSASDRPQRVVLIEGPVTPGAAAPRV